MFMTTTSPVMVLSAFLGGSNGLDRPHGLPEGGNGRYPRLLHGSPPMTGIEQPRVFLAVDDLADHS